MPSNRISEAVIRRLPRYYRYLTQLKAAGVERISSQGLGARMGLTASQIRQDINCFGTLGQQGYGYNVAELQAYIASLLDADRCHDVVIVGAGRIGQAVAQYPGFVGKAIRPLALFDVKPALFGQAVNNIPILDIAGLLPFLQAHPCSIGVVATPAAVAQETALALARGGIQAIWNFAPVDLRLPEGVVVNNVHLSDSLYVLLFMLKEANAQDASFPI